MFEIKTGADAHMVADEIAQDCSFKLDSLLRRHSDKMDARAVAATREIAVALDRYVDAIDKVRDTDPAEVE